MDRHAPGCTRLTAALTFTRADGHLEARAALVALVHVPNEDSLHLITTMPESLVVDPRAEKQHENAGDYSRKDDWSRRVHDDSLLHHGRCPRMGDLGAHPRRRGERFDVALALHFEQHGRVRRDRPRGLDGEGRYRASLPAHHIKQVSLSSRQTPADLSRVLRLKCKHLSSSVFWICPKGLR